MSSSKFVGQLKQNNEQINNLKEITTQAEKHMVVHEQKLTEIVDEFIEKQNYELKNHTENKNNPHQVTKEQLGLGKVINIEQAAKSDFDSHTADTIVHITTTERNIWNAKETTAGSQSKADQALTNAKAYTDTHVSNKSNPHGVTASQIGLGNLTNDKQATKSEFDLHAGDTTKHVTATERNSWLLKSDITSSVTSGDTSKVLNGEGAKLLNDKITELQNEVYLTDLLSVTTGEVTLKDDITKYKKLLVVTGGVSTGDVRTSLVRCFYTYTFRPLTDTINVSTSRGKFSASITSNTSISITQADDALRYIIGLKY